MGVGRGPNLLPGRGNTTAHPREAPQPRAALHCRRLGVALFTGPPHPALFAAARSPANRESNVGPRVPQLPSSRFDVSNLYASDATGHVMLFQVRFDATPDVNSG